MTTAQDLRELCDELDAALTGWLRPSYSLMTTEIGKKAEILVKHLREKYFTSAMKQSTLEMKLEYAIKDNDGLRECNKQLTDIIDKYERNNS